jgi:hypothetical protein
LGDVDGYFVSAKYIEVDLDTSVARGDDVPVGSLLKSDGSLALKYATSGGGTKIYPISGQGNFNEGRYAAFSNWRVFATDRVGEKPIYAFNSSMDAAT